MKKPVRNMIIVLGDQLNSDSSAFNGFDGKQDVVWMAEVGKESTHVWTHKARIVLFLSAMRHFRDELCNEGYRVIYNAMDGKTKFNTFTDALTYSIQIYKPELIIVVEPGEWRVKEELKTVTKKLGTPLEIRSDTHFMCSTEEFTQYAQSKNNLIMEYFYRNMRKRYRVLMDGNKPEKGKWNFDKQNRKTFGKQGPGMIKPPCWFAPDQITSDVIQLVEKHFKNHPGTIQAFQFAVTRCDVLKALDHFIKHHLPSFGDYQDAMWIGEPFLHHTILSYAFNLKLLNPREVIAKAEKAYLDGHAPIAAVEGFIRQILGWREYVRGIYWLHMPNYLEQNAFKAKQSLPAFYWDGKTKMNCMNHVIGQTLKYGYAHHIQRLMVTGLFALLYGVNPKEVHEWYLAVYVDAVEWVELPNTLGMSQFADGGIMATKPYAATGKYIDRMSNYCKNCPFDPAEKVGDAVCPFTTLYWDFLLRNETQLKHIQRMKFQIKNLDNLDKETRISIQKQAKTLIQSFQ